MCTVAYDVYDSLPVMDGSFHTLILSKPTLLAIPKFVSLDGPCGDLTLDRRNPWTVHILTFPRKRCLERKKKAVSSPQGALPSAKSTYSSNQQPFDRQQVGLRVRVRRGFGVAYLGSQCSKQGADASSTKESALFASLVARVRLIGTACSLTRLFLLRFWLRHVHWTPTSGNRIRCTNCTPHPTARGWRLVYMPEARAQTQKPRKRRVRSRRKVLFM